MLREQNVRPAGNYHDLTGEAGPPEEAFDHPESQGLDDNGPAAESKRRRTGKQSETTGSADAPPDMPPDTGGASSSTGAVMVADEVQAEPELIFSVEDEQRHQVLQWHAAKRHRIEARKRWEAQKEPEPVLDIEVA